MQNGFFWYELMTTDPEAAADFYCKVVGWTLQESGMPGYQLFGVPSATNGVAGLMALPDELKDEGVPPHWMGYVWVEDVDAIVARFNEKGGSTLRAAEDIPGIGRFAVVADPHGAALSVMTPTPPEGKEPEWPEPMSPGTIGWNELYAGNGDEAFAFYAGIFGWSKEMEVDMGPMGVYRCFGVDGKMAGGMMTKPDTMPAAMWCYYFTVEALDPAIETLKAEGGTVVNGPHEVPGGSFIVQAIDPQGGFFALTAAKR